jgi:hypothetical protein
MNRRNFVVGLGTVATISGVASVTAASFTNQVNPTTNFQIVPENAELVVRRLNNYDTVSGNDYFANSSLDFANETSNVSTDVVAYVNETENDNLGAELALNNTNETTFDQYHAPNASGGSEYTVDSEGFFEVANLGDTDETIAITLNYNTDVVGNGNITENQVANLFQFHDNDGNIISPDPDGSGSDIANNSSDPVNEVTVTSGEVEKIGLAINLDQDIKESIQAEAGTSPFEETADSVQILESINVGTDYDPSAG